MKKAQLRLRQSQIIGLLPFLLNINLETKVANIIPSDHIPIVMPISDFSIPKPLDKLGG